MKYSLVLITIAFSRPAPSAPQNNDAENAFIEAARTATAKYQDRSVAIAEGYRQIGSDFPAMGEHWIRIGLLFDGIFDPTHPEILNYAVVSGKPQLLGVAYVVPLLPGESAPDWPVAKEKWHDHFRTLEDETALPQHHTSGHAHNVSRMTMLHAWIWLTNPAGLFAADNWAIPYVRLGIKPPVDGPEAAAKALALVSGGSEHFYASISATVPLNASERQKVGAALARSRVGVESLLRDSAIDLSLLELKDLSAIWTGFWKQVDSSIGSKSRLALQRLPIR
jgi:hypothetical protein